MRRPWWLVVWLAGVVLLVLLPFASVHLAITLGALFWSVVAVAVMYG